MGKKTYSHRPPSYVQTRRETQEPVMNTLNHHKSLNLIKSINIDEPSNVRIFENLNHDKRSSLENLPASIFPGFDL